MEMDERKRLRIVVAILVSALILASFVGIRSECTVTTLEAKAPTNLRAAKVGATIINLTWDDAPNADYYRVYRSNYVNGSGPWTLVNDTITTTNCARPDLADDNNYSYAVRAVSNSMGENLTYSNIAFKLCFLFVYNIPPTTSLNVFSLPYTTALTNASALKSDIGCNCTSVKKWISTSQIWQSYPPVNFPITPGASYAAVVMSNTLYKIVGSHNDSLILTFVHNAHPVYSFNCFSLPYHTTLSSYWDLKNSIPNCTSGYKWRPNGQSWAVYRDGYNFSITPGNGYAAVVSAETSWKPPVNNP